MQRIEGVAVYSASDLNNFLECRHLTELDRLVALGELERPVSVEPMTELIARKGEEHEGHYLQRLTALQGEVEIVDRPAEHTLAGLREAEARTVRAMERGVRYIYQATFFDGMFMGHADFLRRIETKSAHWDWSYEVIDTKLALHPKPYFLVQLCNYSEHVERVQGTAPEFGHIVLGSGENAPFRLADYAAYYRHLKRSFLTSVETGAGVYPVECAHCVVCPWNARCTKRRDDDDHLSLVAGIRRDQIAKLEKGGIHTLAQLAAAGEKPQKMTEGTFERLKDQAQQQHLHRVSRKNGAGEHFYKFRSCDELGGFAKLPEPDPGDIFFDIEGDPLYRADRGLEYLWGLYLPAEETYRAFWGTDPQLERKAFESFVDFVVQRRKEFQGAHVYHYASYEISVLKRLMGRYGSREREIDDFLRQGVFVDLYPVVRQGLVISQPSYSIKKVEAFYGLQRETHVKGGDESIVMFESWLDKPEDSILEDIRAYNEDDCRSTFRLREWLRVLRDELNAGREKPLEWRGAPEVKASEAGQTDLEKTFLDGLPAPDSAAELRDWTDEPRARWLLGNLLQYHRREDKPEWWKYFDRCASPQDLQEYDDEALGGLALRSDVAPYKRSPEDRNLVYTYAFPPQEHRIPFKGCHDPYSRKGAGEIVCIDGAKRELEIKLTKTIEPDALRALIPGTPIPIAKKQAAMERLAQAYAAGTLQNDHPATLQMLLARAPALKQAGAIQPGRVTAASVSSVIGNLDRSALFVQGPPGSGKTTAGAHAIVDLMQAGKRVGVVAQSHKAVHNLLRKVEEVAKGRAFRFHGCHKESKTTEGSKYEALSDWPMMESLDDIAALTSELCLLAAGTTYAWADESLVREFDYVFIDEAGQVSLADALIASLAGKNVVLLGDPLQLPQVTKGTHPAGTDLSILEHLLAGDRTIPPDRGVFLDTTYRLQPALSRFISENIYDGRLHHAPSTESNAIDAPGFGTAGPVFEPVEHDGNGRKSDEEAAWIAGAVGRLLQGRVTIGSAPARPMTQDDILIVAPYNLQRIRIKELLEAAGYACVRVGTVDKFQGQEAAVVIYSMATSSSQTLPRDAAFLFDKNRFNVAISRAQCASVIVCSPRLLESPCKTPDQMALVNLLCAYQEAAQAVSLGAAPAAVKESPKEIAEQLQPK
ncbi:MAG TPA: TM0106 family RecB-like putative nuclease [Candidatus Rubrimentiphilum sp.]|nr:TM0106 family RecB-like putative nuclease [Candidatus Rubrimentiphilum sp.]